MTECLIGLGSNLGDRTANIKLAVARLCANPHIEFVSVSELHPTLPVGGPSSQGPFLNGVLRIATRLSPPQLLDAAREVERQLGRVRRDHWGPRVIDVDILLYGQLVYETEELTIPHPRMAVRRFVLDPALEVAADMIHPPTGWSLASLRQRLDEPPYYIAVAGVYGQEIRELARQVAASTGANVLLDTAADHSRGQRLPDDPLVAEDEDGIVERELAALTRRLVQLQALVSLPADAWVLSDYWVNQSLAVARALREGSARQRLERAGQAAAHAAPLPKLVLLLDVPGDALAAPHSQDPGTAAENQESSLMAQVARELRRQAALPGQGPVVRIRGDDRSGAITELLAAMDAMR